MKNYLQNLLRNFLLSYFNIIIQYKNIIIHSVKTVYPRLFLSLINDVLTFQDLGKNTKVEDKNSSLRR